MPKVRVFFSGGNKISFLHSDGVHLNTEGLKKTVTRVSDVEYDHNTDEWVATLRDGTEIARNKLRDAVLAREREVIDQMKRQGTPIPGLNSTINSENMITEFELSCLERTAEHLREITGAGMMECRRALKDSEGDVAIAEEILREWRQSYI